MYRPADCRTAIFASLKTTFPHQEMHVPFLEDQAKDSDPDVASAAKELLDRAK